MCSSATKPHPTRPTPRRNTGISGTRLKISTISYLKATDTLSGWQACRCPRHGARSTGGNRMLEMTNENFARLLRGLTIAVGNRRNRILLYQFLAAEIRALHCSYGVGDDESYKRALTFLENCERYTLRSLVRRWAKHHAEVTGDHAKRVFAGA